MGAAARRGRLTDTEAISFSLLLLLARSATHAEGVTLFYPLTTVFSYGSGGSPRESVLFYKGKDTFKN